MAYERGLQRREVEMLLVGTCRGYNGIRVKAERIRMKWKMMHRGQPWCIKRVSIQTGVRLVVNIGVRRRYHETSYSRHLRGKVGSSFARPTFVNACFSHTSLHISKFASILAMRWRNRRRSWREIGQEEWRLLSLCFDRDGHSHGMPRSRLLVSG